MPRGGGLEPADLDIRLRALSEAEQTFLVEAGAGSGKTSIMAGRAALMIANGEDPGAIVAITFTEAAAAELRLRIETFLRDLAGGRAPRDLAAVFADGVPAGVAQGARAGLDAFDRLTATTIHGFAQRILRPYPLEAGMDPGAEIADPEVAAMAFSESVEGWMRDLLNGDARSFTGALFDEAPTAAAEMVRKVARAMQRERGSRAPEVSWDPDRVEALRRAIARWLDLYPEGVGAPDDVHSRSAGFRELVGMLDAAPADPVARLLKAELPQGTLATQSGSFYARAATKMAWTELARDAGRDKAWIEARCLEMGDAWDAVREAWAGLKAHAAEVAARRLTEEVAQALESYEAWKRAAALLDFEDLLVKARNLLAGHDEIRRKLATRHARVLVDEFQDTDPLQMEIIWRICGDPDPDAYPGDGNDWRRFRIRPGALFLVGDPKQAIYRFRGADVRAYLEAKELLTGDEGARGPAGELLSISVNFRSTGQILSRVNEVFEPVLGVDGQPGFTALSAHRRDEGREVQALEVEIGPELLDDRGQPTADGVRLAEAGAVADFLVRVIGSLDIPDDDAGAGATRAARPGDIALLAPAGTAFWIYEAALERAGVPVAPQAGKGFLNRQEVLDMTALARALADPRDSLALGAFLRGPVAGFTDEEILDGLGALSGSGRKRLSISMDAAALGQGRFREVLEELQALRSLARITTPYQTLAAAVEAFAIRAVLASRHPRSVERSLANLDAFLALSRAWDTRGLKAFADEMRRRKEDGVRAAEGRPDSGTDAVSIVTMHSAKGLEWPIVVSINMATGIIEKPGPIAGPDGLLLSVLGVEVPGYAQANQAEAEERARERMRLLYVADTRARDLLLLPRYSVEPSRSCWSKICAGRLEQLPSFDLSALSPEMPARPDPAMCAQGAAEYAGDSARVAAAHRNLVRRTPSRHDVGDEPRLSLEVVAPEEEFAAASIERAPVVGPVIQGGILRGRVLHKLIEEVMTTETAEADLETRAASLIEELGAVDAVEAEEAAEAVARALALPEVGELRPRLVAEADLAFLAAGPGGERLTIGVADALALTETGAVDVVIDWKSDVAPDRAALDGYRRQMADYLEAVGAMRGLIVLMTEGRVIEVATKVAESA